MSSYICLDSSVIIKVLVFEEYSDKAISLFNSVLENKINIILPDFAWAEIGTVLRKKERYKHISTEDAKKLWEAFMDLEIYYINNSEIMNNAWDIMNSEDLPTLYDAAYIAVAKTYSNYDDICEFWTADEKLVNSIDKNKRYIKFIKEFQL